MGSNSTEKNGRVLLGVLSELQLPVTSKQIIKHVADLSGVRPHFIRDVVNETLNGGVRYGFVQRTRGKFFIDNSTGHWAAQRTEETRSIPTPDQPSTSTAAQQLASGRGRGRIARPSRMSGNKRARGQPSDLNRILPTHSTICRKSVRSPMISKCTIIHKLSNAALDPAVGTDNNSMSSTISSTNFRTTEEAGSILNNINALDTQETGMELQLVPVDDVAMPPESVAPEPKQSLLRKILGLFNPTYYYRKLFHRSTY